MSDVELAVADAQAERFPLGRVETQNGAAGSRRVPQGHGSVRQEGHLYAIPGALPGAPTHSTLLRSSA
jgi:hypothetical protein